MYLRSWKGNINEKIQWQQEEGTSLIMTDESPHQPSKVLLVPINTISTSHLKRFCLWLIKQVSDHNRPWYLSFYLSKEISWFDFEQKRLTHTDIKQQAISQSPLTSFSRILLLLPEISISRITGERCTSLLIHFAFHWCEHSIILFHFLFSFFKSKEALRE